MPAGPAAAQLAGGPSPMYHHDVRHTGQSHLLGPLFPAGAPAAANVRTWQGPDKVRTSPALSADGSTLYVGLGFDFCAIDTATMATNWCYRLHADVSDSSPAVGIDGTIYIGDRDNTFSAFNHNGTIKFQINRGYEGDVWAHTVIGPATLPAPHQRGTIYYVHDQTTEGVGILRAVNPNGTQKWMYKIGSFTRQSSPAIDAGGTIYLGDLSGYLHAFRDKGPENAAGVPGGPRRIWKYKVSSQSPGLTASPVISADSTTLYIGTSSAIPGIPMGLTALDITNRACFSSTPPTCNPIRWTFATAGKVDQTPALAADGTLYVPAMDGGQKRLYAVNPNGTQKWVFGPISSGSETSAQPIVGADGVVYVGIKNGIYALSAATGTQLWAYQTTNYIQAMPVIDGPPVGGTGTGIIYVPSRDGRIYKISSARGGGGGNTPPVAAAGPDQSATVGQAVTFNGSGSHDPDGDPIITYKWKFGDGSIARGVRVTHTYSSPSPPGGYVATLVVKDGLSTSLPDSVRITVIDGGGGGPQGSFLDNFNRADSDALGGPSQTSPQWTEAAGNLFIAGQQVKNGLRGDNIGTLSDLVGTKQSASGDFSVSDNNASPRLGVLLRFQDARNHYRLYRISGGSSQLRISRLVNGTETILSSVQVPMATVNTPFHLVGSVAGTTLTLTMGTVQISASDTTYTSGTVGVLLNTGPAATHSVDNFCAVVEAGTCP
jgi:hypothetical protein